MNLALLTLLAAGMCASAELGELQIRPADDATRVQVVARLPATLLAKLPNGAIDGATGQRWLTFALVGDNDLPGDQPGPAMFGQYRRSGEQLVFTPRHRLVHGYLYRATLRLSPEKVVSVDHRVAPQPPSPPAEVTHIYPSADELPANQMKFYIHFSQPMREGKAIFDRILLLENCKPVDNPWRRAELWSDDARRFTLWIHPGRIKTGVNLREEEGPVLRPHQEYTLAITTDVLDARGQPLRQTYEKRFHTIPADHQRPMPSRWLLSRPEVGSRQPLRLRFGEPLDHALLHRMLQVRDSHDRPVAGKITLADAQSSWLFHPQQPWAGGQHSLQVDGELEDLAGNTPLRLFDTDLEASSGPSPRLSLPFRPAAN